MPTVQTVSVSDSQPQDYENEHVHAVYDEIAPHFSSTRYKPWPIIAQFLSSLPTGWVGLDSGTGNGKYLPLPADRPGSVWTIGLDRSRNLLQIARKAGEGSTIREVIWGDVLGHPWRDGAFDYAISIATIHHLSTHARRRLAVQRLLKCLSPSHGRCLIYVWAIEQDELSKRTVPTESPAENGGQDVFVPWVLKSQGQPKRKIQPETDRSPIPTSQDQEKVFNRYYHMFAKGELRTLVCEAAQGMGLQIGNQPEGASGVVGIEIVQDDWERSNYYVELRRWECS
ncbi:unnamed protein product [Somion occarium]|uniref:Methyltransferase type 11 domain-containing protein n=1 Tax=Somion occarium TaxID=3059160 RepID=A0ABP1DBR8_9APHY